ncbi:MAG: hypothetical protein JXM74_07065 [Fusobacteriaceae bacterium]|nr:hypothetical protein [Fusobacteriaceae bacterium]
MTKIYTLGIACILISWIALTVGAYIAWSAALIGASFLLALDADNRYIISTFIMILVFTGFLCFLFIVRGML